MNKYILITLLILVQPLLIKGMESIALEALEVASYLYKASQPPNFLNLLLHNPNALQNYSAILKNKMNSEIKTLNSISDLYTYKTRYQEILKKYEAQCPFILIEECYSKKNDPFPCLFDRNLYPEYRALFEENTTTVINTIIAQKNKCEYISFGCGFKLPDLRILTKVLAKNPTATLTIHFIDAKHVVLVDAFNLLGNENHQVTDSPLIIDNILEPLMEKAAARKWQMSNAELYGLLLQHLNNHQEFLRWLKNNFPHTKLSMYTHTTIDDYLSILEREHREYPDVIATADIQDDYAPVAIRDYETLCKKILEKNPACATLWLKRYFNGEYPNVISFSLGEIPQSKKLIFEDIQKKQHTLYEKEVGTLTYRDRINIAVKTKLYNLMGIYPD